MRPGTRWNRSEDVLPSRRPLLLVALGLFAGGFLGGEFQGWALGCLAGLFALFGWLGCRRPRTQLGVTWTTSSVVVLAFGIGAWRAPAPPTDTLSPRASNPWKHPAIPSTTLIGTSPLDAPWLGRSAQGSATPPEGTERIPWRTGGDEVRCYGTARRQVRSAAGPGERAELIHSAWGPESLARCAPAAPRPWDVVGVQFGVLRERALSRTSGLRDPRTRGMVRALCLGDRSELDRPTTAAFTRTGTRHMLALSGLHVGLVAVWIAGPMARLLARLVTRLSPRSRSGGTHQQRAQTRRGRTEALLEATLRSLTVLAMVPMAGGQAPVVRAAIAVSLASLGPCLACSFGGGSRGRGDRAEQDLARPGRRVDALTLWGFALLLECLIDPGAAHEVRVQLSYGATVALILGLGGARRALFARLPAGGRIAPTGRLGLPRSPYVRVPLQVGVNVVVTALAASTVAVLGTLAVTLPTFGEVAPIGIVATPLALPPLALALALGWVEILLPGWLPAGWLDGVVRALFAVLEVADRCPGSPWVAPERPAALLFAVSIAWILAAWMAGARTFGARAHRSWFGREVRRFACLATAVLWLPWSPAPAGLEVIAMDAGHGTAVVLRAPGLDAWVFDAGSRDRGQVGQAVARQLARWDVGRVHVVLSHEHHDHRAGMGHLVERFPLGMLVGDVPDPQGTARRPTRRQVGIGTTTLVDTGDYRVQALRGSLEPGNEGSISVVVRGDGFCWLLCADAEDGGWERLLETGDVPRDVDLMLLPHHGAVGPLTSALLDRVAPGLAWISGPGHFEAQPLLQVRGIWARSTGREGALQWCESGTRRPLRGIPGTSEDDAGRTRNSAGPGP